MRGDRVKRRLAAILAPMSPVIRGSSGRTRRAPSTALKAIGRDHRPADRAARGHLVKTTGDGMLAEFASVVDAVRCAVRCRRDGGAQRGRARRQPHPLPHRHQSRRHHRRGRRHLRRRRQRRGAARGLAEPGGICSRRRVQEDAAGRLDLVFDDLGEQSLKNIARPVRVYRVGHGRCCAGTARRRRCHCPTGRRSRCCRSRTCRATRSRNISPTASSRTSSPGCRKSNGCS